MVFTDEDPVDSVVTDSQLSQTVQEQFTGKRRAASQMPILVYWLVLILCF